MKILFFMRSTVYVRNFESTLRLLAGRGHRVHVAAEVHQYLDPGDLIGRLCREHPEITHGLPPGPSAPTWSQLGVELRKGIDYLRYFRPEYRDASKLRWRAEQKAPVFAASAAWRRLVLTRRGRWLLGRFLRTCDRALPPDPAISAFIHDHRPDLVLVTPLVEPGSPQSDYLRSARALGIRTGLCVYSWDNLTNKGLIHDPLDLVTVWNQAMKAEAVALHRVPAERVVVTGAAPYDHWFTWTPRASREAFCARVGLDPRHPYLLYLCSSRFIAGNELPFVRRWVQEVRSAAAALRGAGVLVRPHPQNAERWATADVSDFGNVVIWPRDGGNPIDEDTRADYYDSIHHSAAVVGINTSALIESAIVGRGVYTLLAPEFRDTQDGTLHFRYLREVNGGLLHVASGISEHVSQLETALRNPDAAADRCWRFVEAFVRPYGMDVAATPKLVVAIEATAAAGARRPSRGPWWRLAARPALASMASAMQEARQGANHALEARKAAKQRDQQERAARRLALERQAAFVAECRARAFDAYLRARERLRPLRDAEAGANGSTPAERRLLAALAPLWDAAPETIAELRRYTAATSGVRAADYDDAPRPVRARFERDLRRLLVRGDSALWVDEPAALGAFGFESGGRRYNEETLRCFRVVSLLQDASLIREFRGAAPRRTVWEIGGSGGFAHHFKTLCPNVTYLMTARPEVLLPAAVYLMTLFPDARFRFYDPQNPRAFWSEWDATDFGFAPESIVARMEPPSLDLTIDLMALERMHPSRLEMHVRRAFDLGCRYIASVCPSGNPDGDLASPVRPDLERLYWLHPVCAPESLARRLSLTIGEGPVQRTYFLGWKRLLV
ncbi:MAG: hypothetical protein HYY76_12005 [Acidobacteria bacterium]|nr:hypothetical protein [Acidobacteriota bacterium]